MLSAIQEQTKNRAHVEKRMARFPSAGSCIGAFRSAYVADRLRRTSQMHVANATNAMMHMTVNSQTSLSEAILYM